MNELLIVIGKIKNCKFKIKNDGLKLKNENFR